MPRIELTHVTKRWKNFYAVEDLNMVIEDNAFITLLGPSGCGKTTTLRMIAGLETPTSGRITIGDEVVFDSEKGINVPANKRHVGFLFQNYALWPNMTVYQNITFGLQNVKRKMPVYDFDITIREQMLSALNAPEKILDLVNSSKDKTGAIDKKKAYLKIIDTYFVSMMTAKKLFDIIAKGIDPAYIATVVSSLENEIASIKAKHKEKGEELGEENKIIVNGQVKEENRGLTKEEIDLAVRKVSRIVKVGMFMDRYPAELSGGQQQRVAIARTLAPEPKVLFMDEPLSNLDAKLRLEMRYELQRLHVETGATFVYVTHDQMEAMTLATKICLINNGVLQQYDAPLTVYNKPNNTFVADFVGNPSINFVEAKGTEENGEFSLTLLENLKGKFIPDDKISFAEWTKNRNERKAAKDLELKEKLNDKKYVEKGNKDEVFKYKISKVDEEDDTLASDYVPVDGDFVLGIRPEALTISKSGKIKGEIYGAMPTGMESTLKIRYGDYLLTSVVFGGVAYQIGSKISLDPSGSVKLFDQVSGELIATGKLELE